MLKKTTHAEARFILGNLRATAKIAALAKGKKITSLTFRNAFLNGPALAHALSLNPHLQSLELIGCHIEEPAKLLQTSARLKSLAHFVCKDSLDPEDEKKIWKLIGEKPPMACNSSTAWQNETKLAEGGDEKTRPRKVSTVKHKSANEEPQRTETSVLLKPETYLASLTPPQAKTDLKLDRKNNSPQLPPLPIKHVETPTHLFYEGMESESNAMRVLSSPDKVRQLTPRRISVLMRLVSKPKDMQQFLTQFKPLLSSHELTTIAEYQKSAAKMLLDDPTVTLTVDELARIGIAHTALLSHQRIAQRISQFSPQRIADIYEKMPEIAIQEARALLNSMLEPQSKKSSIFVMLRLFIQNRVIALEIINHPAITHRDPSDSGEVARLLAHIGKSHPDLILPKLDQLNETGKEYVSTDPVIAHKLLLDKTVSLDINTLQRIALCHPATCGLLVLSHPTYLKHATKEMIHALGFRHFELAAWIIETKTLREKTDAAYLVKMCKDHHHLLMRLLDYGVIKEIPAHLITWKLAHDIIFYTPQPESLSVERLSFYCLQFPDLGAHVLEDPRYEKVRASFSLATKLYIAQNNLPYARKLIKELEDRNLIDDAEENRVAQLFVWHRSLIPLHLNPSNLKPWFRFLKTESITQIAESSLAFANQLLFDPRFIKVLEMLDNNKILRLARAHRDLILTNIQALREHPAVKVKMLTPTILDLYLKKHAPQEAPKTSPTDIKEDRTLQPTFIHPVDALHERVIAFVTTDDAKLVLREERANIVSRDISYVIDQKTLIDRFPGDLSKRGVCAGIGLYYARFMQKHAHDAYKNFAKKLLRLQTDKNFSSSSNLVDRIGYLQHFQSRQISNPIYTKKLPDMTEKTLNEEISTLIEMLRDNPFLCIRTDTHLLHIYKHPTNGTILAGNANTGFRFMTESDLVHCLKQDFSRVTQTHSLTLSVYVIPPRTIRLPKALQKPPHNKNRAKTAPIPDKQVVKLAPEKHKQLETLSQCVQLELKAAIELESHKATHLIMTAIYLRRTLPDTWDFNQQKLATNIAILKKQLLKNLSGCNRTNASFLFNIYLTIGNPDASKSRALTDRQFKDALNAIGRDSFASLFEFPIPYAEEILIRHEQIAEKLLAIGLDHEATEVLRRVRATYMLATQRTDTPKAELEKMHHAVARLSRKLGTMTSPLNAHGLGKRIGYFFTAYRATTKRDERASYAQTLSDDFLRAGDLVLATQWQRRSLKKAHAASLSHTPKI